MVDDAADLQVAEGVDAEAAPGLADPLPERPTEARKKATAAQKESSGRRRGAGKRKAKAASRSRRKLLLGGSIVAGLLLCAGIIVLVVWVIPRGRPDIGNGQGGKAAQGRAPASDFGGLDRTSRPVLFDAPLPGVAPAPDAAAAARPSAPQYRFVAAAPFVDPTPAGSDAPAAEDSREAPRWQVAPDPQDPKSQYTVAADLKFELTSPGDHPGTGAGALVSFEKIVEVYPPLSVYGGLTQYGGQIPPILAGQQGPYLVIPPTWKRFPYTWKLTFNPGGKTRFSGCELIEIPQADLPVIDLRTGASAGKFDWRIPFWLRPVLSPDGQTLVGPYHILPSPAASLLPPETEKEKGQRRALHVWRRDEHKPPRPLPMSGEVASVLFANDRQLVVLVETPRRQLELWDVVDARRTAAVDLPAGLKYPRKFDTSKDPLDLQAYPPSTPNVLAVSPGGKYAAVMSSEGLLFLSLAEAKILGTVPLPEFRGAAGDCLGLEFLPSGNALAVAYLVTSPSGNSSVRFLQIDSTNGTTRHQVQYRGSGRGPLVLSPDRHSFLLVDYPPAGRNSSNARFFALGEGASEGGHNAPTVLRLPEQGPLLVVWQPGERRAGSPKVPTVASMKRESYLAEIQPLLALNDLGLEKRVPAPPADRSAVRRRTHQPPKQWVPVPAFKFPAPPRATALGPVAWPLAWGDTRALTVLEQANQRSAKGHFHRPIAARVLDLTASPTAASGEQFRLLPYGLSPGKATFAIYLTRRSGLPAGMTARGDRFAIADPDVPGRVEVWSSEGKRQFAFRTAPRPKALVTWTDFGPDGQLLTLEDGRLSAWQLGGGAVKAIYATSGGYQLPVTLSPDRSLIAVSRGRAFDILAAATGECLARCGLKETGAVVDFAYCPDGRRLAVLYEGNETLANAYIRRVPSEAMRPGPSRSQLAVWDLAKGEARVLETGKTAAGMPAWVDAEHLAVCGGSTEIIDTRLERVVLSYTLPPKSGSVPSPYFPLERSPDGRLWYAVPQGALTAKQFSHRWQLPSLFGTRTAEEAPFFAADRSAIDVKATPVRLELDLGDEALARTHGERALRSLQQRGWKSALAEGCSRSR